MTGDLVIANNMPAVPTLAPNTGALAMLPQYVELVRQIAGTAFVPAGMRNKPHEILACLLKGYELGFGPMQSLDSIDDIQGRPALKPEAMRGLAAQAGHTIRIVENTNERVTLVVWRKEWPPNTEGETFTWTMEDARAAGLANKPTWKSYPRAMLLARATSEACRAVFPDVIKGLSYTPEEITDFQPDRPSIAPPPDVDADTGEITGGGERILPAPPAGSTRRPPPGRALANREEGRSNIAHSASASDRVSAPTASTDDQAGVPGAPAAPANPPGAAAVPTNPPHGRPVVDVEGADALRYVTDLAYSKGLDDSDLERLAGVDFGGLESLVHERWLELADKVEAAEPHKPVPTEFDVLESPAWPATVWKAYITAAGVGLAALLRESARLCAEDSTLGAAPTKLSDLQGRTRLCQLLAGWVAERGEAS